MKREYMVDLIAEFLWNSNDEYGFKKYAKEDAENLLTMLEKEGMQPPCAEGVYTRYTYYKLQWD